MKLNVGSSHPRGRYRHAGWVCLDINPQGRPHVVGDAFMMPFPDNTFEEIHSCHVLEHLARDKWPLMLAEIFRVLKPGGIFIVEVPDFYEQCKEYVEAVDSGSSEAIHLIRTGIWGKTEREGMGHQFGFDRAFLRRALHKSGFESIERLSAKVDMISDRWRDGKVLVFGCMKTSYGKPDKDVRHLNFNELREYIIK